jgi:hypothetical protein
MFGVYLLNFIIMHIFLFKLPILIHSFFCHIDDFTIHLLHSNIIHYVESPICDTKNEPPYLVTWGYFSPISFPTFLQFATLSITT